MPTFTGRFAAKKVFVSSAAVGSQAQGRDGFEE
jgi:hypothetical protein